MNIKKAPCLAIIIYSTFPENIGRCVQVIKRANHVQLPADMISWSCEADPPIKGAKIFGDNSFAVIDASSFVAPDHCLKQINDPDMPIDTDTDEEKYNEDVLSHTH